MPGADRERASQGAPATEERNDREGATGRGPRSGTSPESSNEHREDDGRASIAGRCREPTGSEHRRERQRPRSGTTAKAPRAVDRGAERVRSRAMSIARTTGERASQGDAGSRQGASIAGSASDRGAERPRRRHGPWTEERNESGVEQ